jgi:YlmC/YmxH family sporulation protein
MHNKDVINISDGTRLGCVDDVEIDTCTAHLVAIVVHGRPKCLGLLGREDDIVIGWRNISVIGEDTILVNFECPYKHKKKKGRGILSDIFSSY